MKTIIVIPTFNEAKVIKPLLQQLRQSLSGAEVSFLVVDDQSPDGTAEVACEAGAEVLARTGKRGLGRAYLDGFAYALDKGADLIVQMDADFSHDPKELPKLLEVAIQHDLVLGSRYIPRGSIEGWSAWRHFCSRSAMHFSRKVLGLPIQDVTSGFRVWTADLLSLVLAVGIKSNGYAFQEEMLFQACRLNAEIKEVPINFKDRAVGNSKLGLKDIVEFFLVLVRLRLKFGKLTKHEK